jgi:acyl-CoA thioesterase FadM
MSNGRQKVTVIPYTVRGIELDATRTVSPGWICRILEHTRWQVFTMNDYALRGLLEGGVARAGTYEYGEPLRHQDELKIETWVARVGRTSFDFGHRITRSNDGATAARARITIVSLGPDGPVPVHPAVAACVTDELAPPAPPWPAGDRTQSWKRQWVVRPTDQDSFGHVNQARYVDYIDDMRWLAAQTGQAAGLEGRLKALSIEYLRETHAGQQVQMEAWVTGEHSRAFELTRLATGEILARGQAIRGEG